MITARRALAAAGVFAVVAAGALQGTASAATVDRSQFQANMNSVLARGVGPNVDTEGFGGYVAGFTGSNHNAVTNFTVNKTGTCNAADKGVAAAVFNFDQVGPDFAAALVLSVCSGGTADYWIRTLDSAGNLVDSDKVVKGGDKIKVTITNTATKNTVKVQNVTRSYAVTVSGPAVDADTIQVGNIRLTDGTNEIPMVNFGKTPFTDTKIGGVPLKTTTPTKYVMVNAGGTVLQTTGAIKADNMDFDLTFKKAS